VRTAREPWLSTPMRESTQRDITLMQDSLIVRLTLNMRKRERKVPCTAQWPRGLRELVTHQGGSTVCTLPLT
jgi:hypothetical protein